MGVLLRTSLRLVAPLALSVVALTTVLPAAVATPAAFPQAQVAAAGLPSVPLAVRAMGTFTGVDLTWNLPADEGTADGVTGFVVHRIANGAETTYSVARGPATAHSWADVQRIPGATYAVVGVNADGEGPASTPVEAAPRSEAITVASTAKGSDGVTRTYLGQLAAQGATQVVPLAASGATQQVDPDIAVSPDGRQVAFSQGRTSLWSVSAVAPQAPPVKILDGSSGIAKPAWSPDGTRIAVERLQPDGSTCIDIVAVAGGTPIRVGCGMAGPTWLPDSQTLVVAGQTSSLLQRVQARVNGAVLTTYAGTELARDPAVSPNGLWIAYLKGTAAAMIPVGGGTAQVGDSGGTSAESLSWAPNTSGLILNRRTAAGSSLFTVPVSPEGVLRRSSAFLFDAPAGELIGSAVWQGYRVAIKPTATVVGPNLSVPFDLTGLATPVSVTCELDGTPRSPCTSPFQQTGVTSGTHVLKVSAVEAGGRGSHAVRYLNVDAVAPTAQLTSPTFDVTKAATATIAYTGADSSGIGSYDVRYRTATYLGNFGAYVTAASATKAKSITLNVAAGNELCVSVRARDVFGNVSGWTAERCFSRPLDDRALTATGWSRGTNGVYYLGTVTSSGTKGASVTRTVQAKRLFLVATKCATCGTLTVTYGGKVVGTVSLYKATTEYQAIIPLPTPSAFLSGTVKLTIRDAGKTNQLDGLAVRRT